MPSTEICYQQQNIFLTGMSSKKVNIKNTNTSKYISYTNMSLIVCVVINIFKFKIHISTCSGLPYLTVLVPLKKPYSIKKRTLYIKFTICVNQQQKDPKKLYKNSRNNGNDNKRSSQVAIYTTFYILDKGTKPKIIIQKKKHLVFILGKNAMPFCTSV